MADLFELRSKLQPVQNGGCVVAGGCLEFFPEFLFEKRAGLRCGQVRSGAPVLFVSARAIVINCRPSSKLQAPVNVASNEEPDCALLLRGPEPGPQQNQRK